MCAISCHVCVFYVICVSIHVYREGERLCTCIKMLTPVESENDTQVTFVPFFATPQHLEIVSNKII